MSQSSSRGIASDGRAGQDAVEDTGDDVRARKKALRERVLAARKARPVAERLADDRARTGHVLKALRDVEPSAIAVYLSVPPHASRPEPGTIELATALHTLGHRVLCPVLSPTAHGPRHDPSWAWFTGPAGLHPGLWGIPEPEGEALPASALREVDLVIASGLAGSLDGRRLGVGGAWYDRALTHRRPGVPVWILLNEDEVVDDLPVEEHDQRVDALVLPSALEHCH